MDIKCKNPITGKFEKVVLDNMIKIKTDPDEVIPDDTLTVYDLQNKNLQVLVDGKLVKFTNAYTDEDMEKVRSLVTKIDDSVSESTIPTSKSVKDYVDNNSGHSRHNYSTDEQVVGTWIDGRPVYEQTCVIPALTNINGYPLFTIQNIDLVINLDLIGMQDDGIWNTHTFKNKFEINADGVVKNFTDYNFSNGAVSTIRYTKTTDATKIKSTSEEEVIESEVTSDE